jgi:ribosomal protein S18 acetylase RimI-like enzyme
MTIRKLTEEDLDPFWQLRLRALQDNPEAFGSTYEETLSRGKEAMRARLRVTEDSFSLGAFDDEHLVGTIRFDRMSGLKDHHKAYIYGMYVAPEMRRHGTGRTLIQALISLAKSMEGLEQLHLAVVTTNRAAFTLYLSLGFEVYGTVPQALKQGGQYWDEYLMVLYLH